MSAKKLYTREEFEELLKQSAKEMAADKLLQKDALEVFVKADQHRWIHQTRWMGEPVLNIPHDMFAIQDIIYRTRPKYILEVGVAWGGAVLFYATLMEILGGKKVIGIDTYIPDDLRQRLDSHKKLKKHFTLLRASSVDPATVAQVKEILKGSREVLVILDSHHTHSHVLKELELYSPMAGVGHYVVCGDTIIEDIPPQVHREREWGPGNNPKTAVREFLAGHPQFKVDVELENKLLFSCNPQGYLVRTKE